MFGFLSFNRQKNYLKESRQVYLIASLIIFFGFLSGAFYSNYISSENYSSYSEVLKNYVGAIKDNSVLTKSISSDIINIIYIFLWSFFIFGKPLLLFFAFKSGFSIGFFVSFFVKVYSFKGFLTGMAILFNYLIFLALPLIILTSWSFNINTSITNSVFSSQKTNFKKMLVPYLLIFILSVFLTFIGNFLNTLIITKIMRALF